jgi:hypothetical protein
MTTPSKTTPRKWSPEEDECLRSVVERMGPRNWKEISKHVPDRSHVQCLQRWNKVLRPGLKKGSWQPEEDERLTKEVNSFLDGGGEVNWSVIARCIEGRTAKQCRERWRCNLDPNINKNEWTVEEDLMIVNLQKELGNRWALLAKSLPGRTENAIKTRFRSLQRSNKRKWSPQEDSMLMQMIRSGSNFEEVSQVLSRRSLNSVRVRYKQLSEGSQSTTVSPPRQAVFAALASAPLVQQSLAHPPIRSYSSAASAHSDGTMLDFAMQHAMSETGGKRSMPFGDFDIEDHASKLPKLEVF